MKTPDSAPNQDIFEAKEKLEPRVAGLWHRATDEYYQALSANDKIGDVRPLDAVLQRHQVEIIRLVAEELSKINKKYIDDDNIVSYLIHEIQYNKTVQRETEHIWGR